MDNQNYQGPQNNGGNGNNNGNGGNDQKGPQKRQSFMLLLVAALITLLSMSFLMNSVQTAPARKSHMMNFANARGWQGRQCPPQER